MRARTSIHMDTVAYVKRVQTLERGLHVLLVKTFHGEYPAYTWRRPQLIST